MPGKSSHHQPAGNWMDVVNASSKWVAIVACGVAVVAFRNREVVWFSIGMVLNTFFAKLLKRLFRQDRPESARGKDDYGMPSSHSQSLTFLSTYATLATWLAYGTSPASMAICGCIITACAFLTWLRVFGGLHSAAQVIVGGAVGFTDALIWKTTYDLFSNGIHRGTVSPDFFDSSLLFTFLSVLSFALWKEVQQFKKASAQD